jgi:hypothetical protein
VLVININDLHDIDRRTQDGRQLQVTMNVLFVDFGR